MKNICFSLVFMLFLTSGAHSQICETSIDGHQLCDFDVTEYYGLVSSPAVSSAGTARTYFDIPTGKLQCSEDGGAYGDCVGSGGATPGGSDGQVQYNDGGSALGGDAGLTYDDGTDTLTIGGTLVVDGIDPASGQVDLNGGLVVGANYVGVETPPTNGVSIEGTAYIQGKELTTLFKNKRNIIIDTPFGEFLKAQRYYYNGSSYVADSGLSIGFGAGESNSGAYGVNVGVNAGQQNEGIFVNNFGFGAGRYSTGGYSVNFGSNAGVYNAGGTTNNMGNAAGERNAGGATNNLGYYAGRHNRGSYTNNFGYFAGQNNTGERVNNFGYYAGRYSDGDDNNIIGSNSFEDFPSNTAGNKTFDYTAVDAGTDRITVTSHGFGTFGDYINVLYTQGTSSISGLTSGNIYQVKVVDTNTIGFRESGSSQQTNITAAGTGTGHTLTPSFAYENVTIIGNDIEPTQSNAVYLGNVSNELAYFNGLIENYIASPTSGQFIIKSGTSTDTERFTVTEAGDGHLDGDMTIGGSMTITGSMTVGGSMVLTESCIILHSPDLSCSSCCVDNADAFSCSSITCP